MYSALDILECTHNWILGYYFPTYSICISFWQVAKLVRIQYSSVQFTLSVVSDSLWPHESQNARPPCPSPTPGVHPNSCASSWWCHSACVDHNKLWKFLPEVGIPDHLTCLLRNLYQVKKQQLELDMKQRTGSKLGKEYVKAVYCHSAYLTYMQSTLCEVVGCMELRLPGEISITSDAQMIPL